MKNEDIGLSPIRWFATLQKIYKNGGAYQNWLHYIHSNKDFLCNIQGKLAAFSIVGAERHKTLRIVLEDYKLATEDNRQKKYEDLVSAKDALYLLVEHTLAVASQEVFSALEKYFSMRYRSNEYPPRFCIKLLKKRNDVDVIYTFARDQGAPFKGEISFETACEENSGFQEVSQSGSPYFCNDIPAQKGAYKNPRLYADRLRSYSESNLRAHRKYFSKNAMPDEEWINCWKDIDDKKRPPATSCYKSTLIMPMTLLAKQVTEEFVSAYNKHWPPVQNKYNFGYLCIDCHEIDFFEDYDKVALFAHTDMFSLFLIEAYSFVLHSNTYAEVEAAIKKYEKSMRKTQQKPLHPRKRNAS